MILSMEPLRLQIPRFPSLGCEEPAERYADAGRGSFRLEFRLNWTKWSADIFNDSLPAMRR